LVVNSSGTETLNALATRGVRHLLVRQIFTTAITFAGGVVLARVLSPADFGSYAITTFIVNIFMFFGDFGLAAAFIQSAEPPSREDLQISFTLQFCLITAVVLLTWNFAPWILRFYPALNQNGLRLVRTVSLLLYLPVFRSISAVQLERSLNFRPIAWAEGIGISLYQIVAVACAVNGWGLWSFVLATFAAGVAACVVLYYAAPWPVRLRFNRAAMNRALKNGISFQSTGIVDLISQWATPAIVGTLLGPESVGYLGLAVANAKRPLLVADSVMRVSFPHFSRLQDDPGKLDDTVHDYLLGFLWVMLLWTGFLWASSAPLVTIVYSAKWLPAVPPLIVFAVALPLDMVIWIMALCYRAINRNWSVLKIFSMRTALNLALAVFLVPRIGFVGIAWAYLAGAAACAVLLLCNFAPGLMAGVAQRNWWLIPSVVAAGLCSRISVTLLVPRSSAAPVQQLLASALPFIAVYLLCSYALAPRQHRESLFDWVRDVVGKPNSSERPKAANEQLRLNVLFGTED
jgi:O-antigen/teichoic acid export membrane protein